MEQWYKCPRCNQDLVYGTNPCPHCKCSLAWSQQGPILYIPPIGEAVTSLKNTSDTTTPQSTAGQQDTKTPVLEKANKFDPNNLNPKKTAIGCAILAVVLVVIAAIIAVANRESFTSKPYTCPSDPNKVSSPSDILSKIKVGMTDSDIWNLVDMDKLHCDNIQGRNGFCAVMCTSLSFNNGVINYKAVREDVNKFYPYAMWLFFDANTKEDPAVIGFHITGNLEECDMTIIGTGRMDYHDARILIDVFVK